MEWEHLKREKEATRKSSARKSAGLRRPQSPAVEDQGMLRRGYPENKDSNKLLDKVTCEARYFEKNQAGNHQSHSLLF